MKNHNLLCILFVIGMILSSCSNPKKNIPKHLKGLTRAEMNELDTPDDFDGSKIPAYSIEGKLIEPDSLLAIYLAGEYTPEPYIDQDSQIQAFVLRETTPEEKEQMLNIAKMLKGNSEAIGQIAKDFEVTDLQGNQFSLDGLRGQVVVMNFWFIACKPCVQEIPELNEIVEEYEGKVQFLAFATDKEEKLIDFLGETPFDYHIIPKSIEIAQEYGVAAYPTHIVLDENSKITYLKTGLGPTTISDLRAEIEKLLAE